MKRASSVLLQVLFSFSLTLAISVTSYAEPANLGQLKYEVQTYHNSGQYEKELAIKIKKIQKYY